MEQPGGTQTTFVSPMGIGPFTPGETGTISLNVADPSMYRYLNFAAMVVPSNDFFVGNDSPIEVFDAAGNFTGPIVIELYGRSVWDNGSEINDVTNGIAFIYGSDATLGADEGGVVRMVNLAGMDAAYLADIDGKTTATEETITHTLGADSLIGRLTIVPEPSSVVLLAMGCSLLLWRRKS